MDKRRKEVKYDKAEEDDTPFNPDPDGPLCS